jgi:2-aminoadipate transaminase
MENSMSLVETTQISMSEKTIDFGIGQPDPTLLPMEVIRHATLHRLESKDSHFMLAYGIEQGSGAFRTNLAKFLSQQYRSPVQPDSLFVTNGSSQGIDLICSLFSRAGDTIFVEDPTYSLALNIFADHQLNVVGVPIDEEGMVIEALEEQLTQSQPIFIYTIPTFHNPTGVTLSTARRKKLVELSQEHEFLIVADEVYHPLSFGAYPPAPLGSHVASDTVLSLGTFSKILAPGLRLGWIQTGPTLLTRLTQGGLLNSGGGLNPFTSAIVASALELGLQDKYLEYLKKTYQQRSIALSAALTQHMPNCVSFDEPKGGFFIWLRFPDEIDTQQLLKNALEEDVEFSLGSDFSCDQASRNYARLSFSFYNEEKLTIGVQRLAVAVKSLL